MMLSGRLKSRESKLIFFNRLLTLQLFQTSGGLSKTDNISSLYSYLSVINNLNV